MSDGPSNLELRRADNVKLDQLPLFPELVEAAKVFEWPVPTGKILSKDEERMLEVATAVFEGKSDRRIAEVCGVNRRSIRPIMRILEERKLLAPLKERLLAGLGRLAELSVQRATEMVEDDLMPAQSIPILMGVAIDKRELLAGGVTSRVEAREVIDLVASWEALKGLVASAPRRGIEAGSLGNGGFGGGLGRVIEVDTARDTGAQGGMTKGSGGDLVAGEGEGGGSGISGGGVDGNGLGGGNLIGKGGSS